MHPSADARTRVPGHAGTMTTDNLLKLLVLALIDSTSIGTLVIPVWLLLRHGSGRIAGKVGVYLAVIGVFYFLVGVLMLTSASTVLDAWGEGARTFAGSRPAHWLALAAGATLLWFALRDWIPSAASKSPTRGRPRRSGRRHRQGTTAVCTPWCRTAPPAPAPAPPRRVRVPPRRGVRGRTAPRRPNNAGAHGSRGR